MAQTITIANIKLDMDIQKLKDGGQFARHELASLSRTIRASEDPMSKMAKEVAVLDRAFDAGGISADAYNRSIDHLAKKFGLEAVYANSAAEAERKKAEADKLATKTTKELAKASEDATRKAASLAAAEQAAIAKQQAAAMAERPKRVR